MMETQPFQQTEMTSVYNSNLLLSEELQHEIHLALTQLYYACCTEETQLFGKPLTPIPQNRFDQMQKLITSSEVTPSPSSFTTSATPVVDTSYSSSPKTPNQFVSPSIKNTAAPSTERQPVISPQRSVTPVVTPPRTSMNIVTPKKKKRADWTPQEHAIFLSFLETGETDFEKMGKALNRTIKQVRDHFYAFRRGLIRNSSHPVNRNFEIPTSSSSSSSRNKENHQNKVLHRDQQQKKDFPTPKIELDKKITKRNYKV